MQFRKSDKKVHKIFKKSHIVPSIEYVKSGNRVIRYIATNLDQKDSLPILLFIHGAPGSSDNFYNYLSDSTLLQHFCMISVDRPGYGYSDFGQSEPSIIKQAEALSVVIEQVTKTKNITIVSHSYGGPIAAKLAMDYPELVYKLIFLAPALDPENEKTFWISYLGKIIPFRWLTPKSFKVATDEKFGHVKALQAIENDWSKVAAKSVYIHGEKDMIVPFENYYYAVHKMNHLALDTIRMPKENHFIPWTQKELVIQKILEK